MTGRGWLFRVAAADQDENIGPAVFVMQIHLIIVVSQVILQEKTY